MRIWDIDSGFLNAQSLLGEHRELHGIHSIITQGKSGYSRHPETLRWVGKLNALYLRHEALVKEMKRRGYNHYSPLDRRRATGKSTQSQFVDSPKEQLQILKAKGCDCNI